MTGKSPTGKPDIFDRSRIADLERIVAALVANQRALLTAEYRLLRGTTAEEAMRRLDEAYPKTGDPTP